MTDVITPSTTAFAPPTLLPIPPPLGKKSRRRLVVTSLVLVGLALAATGFIVANGNGIGKEKNDMTVCMWAVVDYDKLVGEGGKSYDELEGTCLSILRNATDDEKRHAGESDVQMCLFAVVDYDVAYDGPGRDYDELTRLCEDRQGESPAMAGSPADAETPTFTLADFEIELIVLESQCFGSAGALVTVEPELSITGGSYPGQATLVFDIHGGESVETFNVDLDGDNYTTSQELISTATCSAVLYATPTHLLER